MKLSGSKRQFEVSKSRSKKLKLYWSCRDSEHEKILVFETYNDAQQHATETGHKIEYLEVDYGE